MKKIYLIVLLFLLACGVSYAGGPPGSPPPPSTGLKAYTVATIPSASANPNMAIIVTDGNTDTDCETTGGGSTRNICISDGTNWVISGDGTGSTVGGLSVDTAEVGDDGKYLIVDWGNSKIDYDTPAGGGDMSAAVWDGDSDGFIDQDAGGLDADISGYGAGLLGHTAAGAVQDTDTEAEIETALGAINIIVSTEIDEFSELQALVSDKTLVNEEDAATIDQDWTFTTGLVLGATGDITQTAAAVDWDMVDDNASAISFDAAGKAGILTIITSNDAEGLTTSGYFTATGDVTGANLVIGDDGNIGSASDGDSMAIDSTGNVTFSQNLIVSGTGIELNNATENTLTASSGVLSIEGTALAKVDDSALTGDPTLTDGDPTLTFIDSTNSGEAQIAISDNADPDGIMDLKVDEAGTLTSYLQLDGANTTVDVLKNATFAGTVGVTGVLTATAAGANITLADGQLIDLSGVTPSDATDEGLIIPTWVDVTPTTDTPFITYDPASNAIKVYEGGWVSISGGSGAPVDAKYVVWDALNGTLSGEMLLAGGAGVDLTGSGPGYAANGTLTLSFDSTEVDATTWSDGSNASNVWTFDVSGTDHTMTAGNGVMTFGDAVTVTDTLTASNGIALGTSKAITGTTGITFGGVGATTVISSSDWTIDATGVMANMGNITSDGTIEGVTLTEGGEAVYNATETPGGELGGTWASPTIDDSVTVATWTFTGTTTVADIDGSGTISANLFTPDAADGADIGSTTLEFSDVYLADGSIIYGQNDQSNTLTSSATGWEFALDIGFPDGYGIDFGTGDDWSGIWNNTNLAVEFTTALTASTAVGTPMFKIQTDSGTAGMTADQDIFSIYKGSTELFTVDEDGDIWYAGVLSAQATDDAYLGLLQATASDTDWWIGIQGDGEGDDDDPLEFRKSETKDTSVQMELDADGDLHLTGDLYVTGDDIFMNTNTDTAILIADGTNYNVVVPSGDVSITNAGVMTVTDLTISSEAQYDLLTRGAASWERLAIGSEGQYLKVSSGVPTWGDVSATAGGDADDVQYNSGGLAGENAFEYAAATNTLSITQNGTDVSLQIGDDTYSWGHTPLVGFKGSLEVDGIIYADGGLTAAGTITLQNSETITNATNTQVKIAADSGEAIIYDLDTATDQQVEILTDSGVTQLLLNSAIALQFRDTGLYINSNDDGHLDLTADTSIDLNGAVVATSSVSVTGGALTGPISTSSTPGSVANFYGAFVVSSNADIDLTLPSAVDGMSVCFGQGADRTDALTVTAASSDVIVLEGVAGTTEAGGGESTLTSGGAATDRMCLVAVGTTNWYANKVGTWSE